MKFDLVQAGQGLLLAALDHLQEAPAAEGAAARVGVLYNPADSAAEPSQLARLLLATSQLTSRRPKIAGEHLLAFTIFCVLLQHLLLVRQVMTTTDCVCSKLHLGKTFQMHALQCTVVHAQQCCDLDLTWLLAKPCLIATPAKGVLETDGRNQGFDL